LKTVLFACIGNSFRSQIAEGFARAYGRPGAVDVRSGGTSPFGYVSPAAIRLMAEKGIDIKNQQSKAIELAFARSCDAFVTLCGPLDGTCPANIAKRAIPWDVRDPGNASVAEQRALRDDIEARVIELLRSWNALVDGR
jgi:arsenate reductase (thioredoxin)